MKQIKCWQQVSWFCVTFGLMLIASSSSYAARRPNIILVMSDDLGWGDVGFHGNPVIKTPHLDEMARSGIVFHRFYAHAPVCSPTRGSCLTGRHPSRYGIPTANAGHLRDQEWSLAELLRPLGYVCGHFGKWHLGTLTRTVKDGNRGGRPQHEQHFSPPQLNGFDRCFSTESKVPTFDPMIRPLEAPAIGWEAVPDGAPSRHYGTYYWNEAGDKITDNLRGDDSALIMDRALAFVDTAVHSETPFFVVIWFHTPHLPVVSDPNVDKAYDDIDDEYHRNYFRSVSRMDDQVGRLRAALRRHEVHRQTLIAFCSDNGPEGNAKAPGSAGPFRGRKRSLYEGGVRVPGVFEWPGVIPAGGRTNVPAVTSDYLPTVLAIVEHDMPDNRPLDGVSLLPVLVTDALVQRPAIPFQSRDQLALSDARWKLYRRDNNSPWELYDLIDDESESMNVAQQHPQIVADMAAQLASWQESCARSALGFDYGVSEPASP